MISPFISVPTRPFNAPLWSDATLPTEAWMMILFLVLAFAIGVFMVGLGFLRAKPKPDHAKNSLYECGFSLEAPLVQPVSLTYYLIAILFIIFDLEIALLMPWAVTFSSLSPLAHGAGFLFLGILGIGFCYEYKKGAFD
jgi:NADH-quinone oxidoreductase subunit A